MKLCTTCGRRWDIIGPRCPDDGTLLVPAEAASAIRSSASATWSAGPPALAQPRPAASDDLAPGDCVGEYVIERKIGVGGMGVVYGARHPVIGKRAAIKVLNARLTADREALSRFVLEAQAVNQIGHANIVDIFSFGTLGDGRSYFAMEWLPGETLGQRLRRGRLSVREATAILSPLCRALEAAHAAGVIHRDLKPDNVFLATDDDGWRVKLLDFGIAKLSSPTASISRTATGMAVGTPLYMAPEQARGEAVDGRTDVYALGLLAYTMVCGVALFEDEGSAVEVLAAHISKPPAPPRERAPDLPAVFEALILEMIAKQPDQRPALGEIRRRLAGIAADADRTAAPTVASAQTLQTGIAGLPASHPPAMPGALPAASAPPVALPRTPSTASAPGMAALRPPTMPGAAPVAELASGPRDAITSRRGWWPLVLAAVAAVAVAVVAIAVRGRPEPAVAASPKTPSPPLPGSIGTPAAPPTGAAVPLRGSAAAPAVATGPVTESAAAPTSTTPPGGVLPVPAQITAELAVQPDNARLSVDGRPVPLIAGRATLALQPGDHEALASTGGRVARQRFAVAAGQTAHVTLRVPAPAAAPRAATHASDDVDGVEDPFRK
jgi:serine/threonine-protein kinase